jgi:hypothetical protein
MLDTDSLKYFQYEIWKSENCKLQSTRSGMHSKWLFYKNIFVIFCNSNPNSKLNTMILQLVTTEPNCMESVNQKRRINSNSSSRSSRAVLTVSFYDFPLHQSQILTALIPPYLCVLGIACLSLRHLVLVGEANAKHSQQVTISCFNIHIGLN